MTFKESAEILKVLKAAYPKYYQNINKDDATDILNLWSTMFAENDVKDVIKAVKAFMLTDTSGFPPTIGQININICKLSNCNKLTAIEAWHKISRACRNSAYHAEKEFNNLPDTLQELVGSPNQLKYWSMLPQDEFETVVQSNFMRSYRNKLEQTKYYHLLPKELLQSCSKKYDSIENGQEDLIEINRLKKEKGVDGLKLLKYILE